MEGIAPTVIDPGKDSKEEGGKASARSGAESSGGAGFWPIFLVGRSEGVTTQTVQDRSRGSG